MIGRLEGIFKIRELTHTILVTEKNPVGRRDAHDMLSQCEKRDTLSNRLQVDNGARIPVKCTQKPPFG